MYLFRTPTALSSLLGVVKSDKSPCKWDEADARTRTEDPFITSFGPLSSRVTASHLRSRVAPNPLDWR